MTSSEAEEDIKIKLQFAKRVQQLHGQQRKTYDELALKTKMHAADIKKLQYGTKNPTLTTLRKVSVIYQVTIESLFDFSEIVVTADEIRDFVRRLKIDNRS